VGDRLSYSTFIDRAIQKYDLRPQQIQSLANICLVTDQEGKMYALKKSKQSKEKLLLLHRLLEGVREAGFDYWLPWLKTVDGEAVVSIDDTHWYTTPWKKSEDDAIPSPIELIRSLGKFHSLAQPLVSSYQGLAVPLSTAKLDHWKSRRDQLAQFSSLQEREFLSPFEKSYGEHQELLNQSFDFSIRGLERFLQSESARIPRYTLCHCRIHPSNIVMDDEQFYWIDYDHAQVDTPVRDLAMFIHRFVPKAEERVDLSQLIEAYEEINPLLPLERKLLAVYLSYPEPIVKIVQQYQDKPKISHEAAYVKQLEQAIGHLETTQGLIRHLWTTKRTQPSPKRVVNKKRSRAKR
jgi:spore coat protein YsxE